MNRLTTFTLGVIALTWATGCCCCHKYQSSCVDADEGCCLDDQRENCRERNCRNRDRRCRDERCRGEKRGMDNASCCPTDCCESGYPIGPSAPATYDTGCSGCAGSTPMMGAPVTGGCASGNCGTSMPTYGGMPIDPSSGWTITPVPSTVPTTSEPVAAPPAGSPALTPSGGTGAINPVPMPISPPVGAR